MSRLLRNPAFILIEDQLDALGQKYRVQLLLRGTLLWVASAAVSTFLATLAAHLLGTNLGAGGKWIAADLALWLAWLTVSLGYWVIKPLVFRPDPLAVARLIETRIAGLHNGLTNSLLLARRDDIADSPWMPQIFEEILGSARSKSLGDAIKLADLGPLGLRLGCVIVPLVLLSLFPPVTRMLTHGWSQVLSPTKFVPKIGLVSKLEVQPGDITLVAGQPLEVTLLASGADLAAAPTARLIFDGKLKEAELIGTQTDNPDATPGGRDAQLLRYTYRLDHVDQPLRYRAEVGGTQSPWFTVNVVRHVQLEQLTLDITPPAYTGQKGRQVVLKPEEIEKTPVIVPQGSRVELSVTVDVPVKSAMLQLNDAPPAGMETSMSGQRFTGRTVIVDDADMAVLLTEGAGQIIATVPEQKFTVHCVKDAPPTIEMKWPTQDTTADPAAPVKILAHLRDDYGVATCEVFVGMGADDGPLASVGVQRFEHGAVDVNFAYPLNLQPEQRQHGKAIRVQLVATDNRDLHGLLKSAAKGAKESNSAETGGPQSVSSQIYKIEFRDPAQIAAEEKDQTDRLLAALTEMLKLQQKLYDQTIAFKPLKKDLALMARIGVGQTDLRTKMQTTATTFQFDDKTRLAQKALTLLARGEAKEAVELTAAIQTEAVEKEVTREAGDLQARQRRIIGVLESLIAMLNASAEPTTQPAKRESGQIPSRKEELEKLNEALKQFMKEEQRILDQTASLAKKPVDNFDDKDKKLLEDLKMAQEKMDAFMEQKLSDFSKNAEQDMSNPALLKELMAVYSEVTMAKDALNAKTTQIAVAAEEMGLENAKELSSNIEKWLPNSPDRTGWSQEDPTGKNDTPMAELPKELEDMVGELMEQQEDLNQQMEDANANWTDSMDKGIGWDAADGPIASMSAKGVTGNTLPKDNEMGGRSGEGRNGKSQGEFVGDTAQGKGGRNTPTRLDPTPFQAGQIKDESKDPVGGATGGGKMSGQGGQGLEGPVPPKVKAEMQRLADKQAQLRNNAERLQLKYQMGRYDNFKMQDTIALMRRVESDLTSNRYQQAMRTKDVLLDRLDTSRLLVAGRISVDHDTTPTGNAKLQANVNDAMKGELPAAWSEALKEYYKKLSQE